MKKGNLKNMNESQKSGLIFITTAKKRQIKMKIYEYFLTGCLI